MKRGFGGLVLAAVALCVAGDALGQELSAFGVTEPVSDTTLGTSVGGTVASIAKREGARVKKGDIILELDSDLEALEVERRKLMAESQAKKNSAESKVETLRIDLDSTRKLYEATKSVSKEDLQKKELELKLAEAEFEGLQMDEKREAIEYNMAVAQLERKRIKAPFDGVVTKIFLEEGENCSPQQPLARVVDVSRCRFVTHIEAGQPWKLEAGSEVTLRLQGSKDTVERSGKVEYVSPVVDPSSGLQEVTVLFDNSDGAIRPGVNGTMVRANAK